MSQNSQIVPRPSRAATRKRAATSESADARPSKKTPPVASEPGQSGASGAASGQKGAQARKPQKSKPSEAFRLRKKDWPPGSDGTIEALKTFLRVLMNYFEPNTPPPLPDPVDVHKFGDRYKDASDVFRDRFTKPSNKQLAILQTIARLQDIPSRSTIAAHAAQLEEHAIHTAIAVQCHYGLEAFRPDLFASPYSAYNSAHRIFALDAFVQLAIAHAFFFLQPKLSLVRDVMFLTEVYNHVVHHEWKNLARMERKQVGAVADRHAKNNVSQRRIRTRNARRGHLEDNEHAPDRYVSLVADPNAHSDDELRPGLAEEYQVADKPRRSARCDMFMVSIDARRHEFVMSKPRARMTERKRVRVENPHPPAIRALPEPGIPLDFFGPAIFNNLPYAIRRRYSRNPRIALPRKDSDVWSRKYMAMSDAEFMEKEGKEMLKDYDLASDASDDDSDGMDVDDEGAPAAVAQAQQFAQLMGQGASATASSSGTAS